MKIYMNDLMRLADIKKYDVSIDYYPVENNIFLRGLKDVEGNISFYYDGNDDLCIHYHLIGKMVCPDALTLQDVDEDFEIKDDDKIVFDENSEGFFIRNAIELEDLVYYIVLPEVPIKVVKNKKIEYDRGDGWIYVSEQEYESQKEKEIDPRLQKLSELKIEEDD